MFPPCRWKWTAVSDNSTWLLLGDCDPWEVKDKSQYQSTLVLAFIVTIFGIEVRAKHLYRRKSSICFPVTTINTSSAQRQAAHFQTDCDLQAPLALIITYDLEDQSTKPLQNPKLHPNWSSLTQWQHFLTISSEYVRKVLLFCSNFPPCQRRQTIFWRLLLSNNVKSPVGQRKPETWHETQGDDNH